MPNKGQEPLELVLQRLDFPFCGSFLVLCVVALLSSDSILDKKKKKGKIAKRFGPPLDYWKSSMQCRLLFLSNPVKDWSVSRDSIQFVGALSADDNKFTNVKEYKICCSVVSQSDLKSHCILENSRIPRFVGGEIKRTSSNPTNTISSFHCIFAASL